MATTPAPKGSDDLAAKLQQKLADIGLKEDELEAQKLAEELGLPYSNLQGIPLDSDALISVPEEVARASGLALISMKKEGAIVVLLDPRRPETQQELAALATKHVALKQVIVSAATMARVLKRYEAARPAELFEIGAITVDDATLASLAEGIKNVDDLRARLQAASTTELFEVLVGGALATKASDIHFEPEEKQMRLRYRLDGLLHEITTLDLDRYKRVLSRLKVLSKMKLNVTKAPQDGRFAIRAMNLDIGVRVSVLPSEYGESVVMRLLDPRGIKAKIEDLGMRPDLVEQVKELLGRPQGTLMTTGPTGSGKTTTLYAFLNFLNTPDLKIITVEDPIEYHITGLNQTQVDPTKGYTFGSGLRAIVRQDPDVILIGEIRDLETASIALEAALTGHMVLSTIHTNDAAGTVPRLIDIGVEAATIAPALTMAMGQRLLRRLCTKCKKVVTPDPADIEKAELALAPIRDRFKVPAKEALTIYGPVGCSECNNIGYKGRVGVYEVFEVTRDMERLILKEPGVSEIRDLAIQQGMITMLQDGYLKLSEGTTSIEEIRRVLG